MKQELQQKFYDEFPGWFDNLQFGFEVNDGWFNLLWNLCVELKKTGFGLSEEGASQVKEKFGSLRFYIYGGTDEQWKLIDEAEEASYTICEQCGKPSEIRKVDGWFYNMCDTCYKEYLENQRKLFEKYSKKV